MVGRNRSSETAEERTKRMKKNAQDEREANTREDEAMHALVKKSLQTRGP